MPALATSCEILNDGLAFRFQLRPGDVPEMQALIDEADVTLDPATEA